MDKESLSRLSLLFCDRSSGGRGWVFLSVCLWRHPRETIEIVT